MTIMQSIILGIVQGITEFFPISSSGHLVILQNMFGLKESMVSFDVFLHLGTLVSVMIFFRKDIINILSKDRAMLAFIIISCIPTLFIGLLFRKRVEALFTNVRSVGISLVITGIFLLVASFLAMYWKRARKVRQLGMINSIIIGIAQGVAVVPGISRSGATIGTALASGIDEEMALKFSFLLAIPAILGANLLKARQICGNLVSVETIPYMAGAIAAMITGLIAIKALFSILRKNLFFLFGIYCILTGFAVTMFVR